MIEDWVRECREGRAGAYAHVVEALRQPVLEFLYRMTGDRGLAEDLGQEAFLKAYRNLDRYDGCRAKFSTWLFAIARNLCLNALRKRPAGWEPLDASAPEPDGRNPFLLAAETQLAERIAEAVRSLDPPQREVFVLIEYRYCTLSETAEIVGCPQGTVKSRLHRARMRGTFMNPVCAQYRESLGVEELSGALAEHGETCEACRAFAGRRAALAEV